MIPNSKYPKNAVTAFGKRSKWNELDIMQKLSTEGKKTVIGVSQFG